HAPAAGRRLHPDRELGRISPVVVSAVSFGRVPDACVVSFFIGIASAGCSETCPPQGMFARSDRAVVHSRGGTASRARRTSRARCVFRGLVLIGKVAFC